MIKESEKGLDRQDSSAVSMDKNRREKLMRKKLMCFLKEKNTIKEAVKDFLKEDDGVGVIEVVLILVVLISLVLIFKKQITNLLNDIFKQISTKSKEVY